MGTPEEGPPETVLVTSETWPYIAGTPRHTKLQAWLRENGIDPKDVAVDQDLKVVHHTDGPVIDHHVFLRNEDGCRYMAPDNPHEAAKEHRTTPCTTAPPVAKRADLTTRAVLQCIVDLRAIRSKLSLAETLGFPSAWDLLCTVYPDKVVTAAFHRENDRDFLDYGVNVTYSFITAEGSSRLHELGGNPIPSWTFREWTLRQDPQS